MAAYKNRAWNFMSRQERAATAISFRRDRANPRANLRKIAAKTP